MLANPMNRSYAQHEVYVGSFGYYLHPSIELPKKDIRIACFGQGTSLFLEELASQLPKTAKLHVFDSQAKSLRPSWNVSSNITVHAVDERQSFPEELHGIFDVVVARLLAGTLVGNDWRSATDNFVKLLKPGGWLQWQEPDDVSRLAVQEDDSGAQTRALQAITHEAIANRAVRECLDYPSKNLEDIFRKSGLRGVGRDVVASDRLPHLSYTGALVALHGLLDGFGMDRQTKEGNSVRLRECMEDVESGAYLRYNLLCFIGQKSL
ncbi:S-adenosyl-L-methionine-dependent methyltransferase [Xylaria intraflava]|nr:S-adenosyl-L-methionine-dependent methyltransferase [Xylaria intraflava]